MQGNHWTLLRNCLLPQSVVFRREKAINATNPSVHKNLFKKKFKMLFLPFLVHLVLAGRYQIYNKKTTEQLNFKLNKTNVAI